MLSCWCCAGGGGAAAPEPETEAALGRPGGCSPPCPAAPCRGDPDGPGSPGPAGSWVQGAGYRAAPHRPCPGRLARPERGEFAEPPQQPPHLDEFQQLPQPALGAAALRRRDDTAAEHFPELVLAGDDVGHRVLADQDVGEQVNAERAVSLALHWRGDVAVDREPAGAVAGLGQASAEAGGDVDLEPVTGERVMPQHHPVVDRLADSDVVVQAQHARGLRAEDPHRRLVRMEIVIGKHATMLAPAAHPAGTSRPRWQLLLSGLPLSASSHRYRTDSGPWWTPRPTVSP